jgi:penicillin-binding protein 1C
LNNKIILRFNLGAYYFCFSRRQLFNFFLFIFLCYFITCLPKKLFDSPYATILLDENGVLLNAQIAEDGQWRFPKIDSVPKKFEKAIITYEDNGFYDHWGVSIPALFRATWQNLKNARIVSGGSTLTMQIARMSRGGDRTFFNKLIEIIMAYRLEFRHSKEDLIRIYATHAPFGGNVVGLEAASWRYFSLPPHQLSWAQMATLAVLPNSPGLIHPGRNRDQLLRKRNFVLKKLFIQGDIDEITFELSLEEQLPNAPKRLPSFAPHLMDQLINKKGKGKRFHSTINQDLQVRMTEMMGNYQSQFNQKEIHNAALIIVDAKLNEVKAYVGNSSNQNRFGKDVDIIQAPRSTGSILKPFLYAAMIQEGKLNNEQLIPDIPIKFDGFSPKNFSNSFNGAVRAKEALARSLNIPAVFLLKEYGIGKFLHLMQRAGQKHINRSEEDYGLSLILGGAESSLWDVVSLYNGMSRNLSLFNKQGKYDLDSWQSPSLESKKINEAGIRDNLFDAASIYLTFQAMQDVNRPDGESGWQYFASSKSIAWKTGTSFGNRDAWAVGCTPDYTVGVWVGNASGEGRPELIGGKIAAPVMLDVFSRLNSEKDWFEKPIVEMREVKLCRESGFLASSMCVDFQKTMTHKNVDRGKSCHYHERIITDSNSEYRYHKDCEPLDAKYLTKFVLPPIQAWYYRFSHADYTAIPPYHPSCGNVHGGSKPAIVYPQHNAELLAIRDLAGNLGEFVFEAAHHSPDAVLFWHLDEQYLGSSETIHKMACQPEEGKHILKVIDAAGNEVSILFEVIGDAQTQ